MNIYNKNCIILSARIFVIHENANILHVDMTLAPLQLKSQL